MRTFVIHKVGQTPAWNIQPPKTVERALDPDDLELYTKGLICMSQSYGIGAVGYFRRVVENAIGALLDLVEDAAKTDEDAKALEAVQEARKQKNAEQKLQLVAEMAPASLRTGNVNPLATLYANYSRELHALSDEECLQVATELREALDYLFGNLWDQLGEAKASRENTTKRATSKPWDNA